MEALTIGFIKNNKELILGLLVLLGLFVLGAGVLVSNSLIRSLKSKC